MPRRRTRCRSRAPPPATQAGLSTASLTLISFIISDPVKARGVPRFAEEEVRKEIKLVSGETGAVRRRRRVEYRSAPLFSRRPFSGSTTFGSPVCELKLVHRCHRPSKNPPSRRRCPHSTNASEAYESRT